MSRHCLLAIALAVLSWNLATVARAEPPGYLVLRRSESPGPQFHRGYPEAGLYDARTRGYAYGWFGVAPRSHASRHFGFYRTYTQWSNW